MELELDFNSERTLWQGLAIVAVILALIGLAIIGARITPLNADREELLQRIIELERTLVEERHQRRHGDRFGNRAQQKHRVLITSLAERACE